MNINRKVLALSIGAALSFISGFGVGYIFGKKRNEKKPVEYVNYKLTSEQLDEMRDQGYSFNEFAKDYKEQYARRAEELVKPYLNTELSETPNAWGMTRNDYSRYSDSDPINPAPEEEPHAEDDGEEIYVISEEAYYNNQAYDKVTLIYYVGDDTLVDEKEEIIPHRADLIGNALYHFGDMSGDDDLVFVQNDGISVCFEIQKMASRFSDYILMADQVIYDE